MTPDGSKPWYTALYFQVLAGVMLGIAAGHFWPDAGAALKPLGDAFVKLVKMMIVPVVFCTIVNGVAGLSDLTSVGKSVARALGLFYALTVAALLIGWVAIALVEPGVGMHVDPAHLDASVAAKYTRPQASASVSDFILHIIPTSFVGAFADGEVLPTLLLAVLTGFALARLGPLGAIVRDTLQSLGEVLFAIFNFIMVLAPIGAFGAMAFTVGRHGMKSIGSLGMLIGTFYLACGCFVVVVLGLLAACHGFSLWRLLRYFRDELLVVLGTSSSEPVLPRLLQKLEELGCRRSVVGLVLPLGYSFNLDGTAIYLTLATLFIAQACDIHLGTGQVLTMIGVMLLTSKGAAGVTGSGFAALVATLAAMPDVPVSGVAILVGIDRFMSEARALTSTMSNMTAGVVLAIWEGACDRGVLKARLEAGAPVGDPAPTGAPLGTARSPP